MECVDKKVLFYYEMKIERICILKFWLVQVLEWIDFTFIEWMAKMGNNGDQITKLLMFVLKSKKKYIVVGIGFVSIKQPSQPCIA